MHKAVCPSGRVVYVQNILADGSECDDMSKIVVPYKGFELIYDNILTSVIFDKEEKVNEYQPVHKN